LQIASARIASDLKLYNLFVNSPKPLTVQDVLDKTGASSARFMRRLLKYLASQNDIEEVGRDTFTANHITRTLADPGNQGGIYLLFDGMGPGWQVLPEWLKDHNYADVEDPDDTPHQRGHNTKLRTFDWAATRPDIYNHSHQYMKVQFLGIPTWLDVYPWQQAVQELQGPDQVLFVDLGGGIGHQCVALREKVPDLPNRIVLQDTPSTIAEAKALGHRGVDAVVQDIFEPQKPGSRGAKIYYMRNIIHDHSDERSIVILKHTRDALAPGSVILIDDMVVPDVGAHWQAMSLDFAMMASNAALERTLDQWQTLIAGAGLKIKKVHTYSGVLRNSVIECVPA
jgi:demethylsterigmatocystin 6-O-methyltransferase